MENAERRKEGIIEELQKISLTKSSLFDKLRNFYLRQIFVKLKISTVSTFWRFGRTETVSYGGATKFFFNKLFLF